MSAGQGSVTVNQKKDPIPIPGPPFAANSAYNGLSVNAGTGKIQWGQEFSGPPNPAALVSFQEIETNSNGMNLVHRDGAGLHILQFKAAEVNIGDPGVGGANLRGGSLQVSDSNITTISLITGNPIGTAYISVGNDGAAGSFSLLQFIDLNLSTYVFQFADHTNDGEGVFIGYRTSVFPGGGNNRGLLFFNTSGNMYMGDTIVPPTDNGSLLQLAGDIITDEGTMTGAPGAFRIGSVIVAASVLDATQYLETEINGAVVKLAIIT